jgi:hypothetical protein
MPHSLDDLLGDPIAQLLMLSDNIDEKTVREVWRAASERRRCRDFTDLEAA